jgi:hypothetical protein
MGAPHVSMARNSTAAIFRRASKPARFTLKQPSTMLSLVTYRWHPLAAQKLHEAYLVAGG